MVIKVLGMGCASCQRLKSMVISALEELGMEATIVEVKDVAEILRYGVMRTPALVINEKLVLAGKLPSKAELISKLTTAAMEAS